MALVADGFYLKGAKYVSDQSQSPAGPFIFVDLPFDLPEEIERLGIEEMLVGIAEEAGLSDAVFDSPPGLGVMEKLFDIERGVVLRVLLDPEIVASLPEVLIDHSRAWLAGAARASEVIADVGFDFFTTGEQAMEMLRNCRLRPGFRRLNLARGIVEGRPRSVMVWCSFRPSMLFAGGGPEVSAADMVEMTRELAAVAVFAAPFVTTAFVDVVDSLEDTVADYPFSAPKLAVAPWRRRGGMHTGLSTRPEIAREYASDAYPFQVFGPGHAKRFGVLPEGAQMLGDGRWGLWIGEPEQWLGRDDRARVRTHGQQLLAPILPLEPVRGAP